MGRRINEGNYTGLKQDRYRHSDFEFDDYKRSRTSGQVSVANENTLGGPSAENRGRRGDQFTDHRFHEDTPFENGGLTNWGKREGWDQYFSQKSYRAGRHGGGIIGFDENDHSGRGPKGYSRPDESIYEEVCEMLTLSPELDASAIEVSIQKGCVYLKGEVRDRATKRMAELIIENISGVQDVQNLLTLAKGDRYVQEQ